jgi:hypothetical protein
MSDLDTKVFKFTFTDLLKNIFTTKKPSYKKNKNEKIDNKTSYGTISY